MKDLTLKSPSSVFPTGWFQVCWADELVPGDIKPLRYFGQDLVCYRGETGRVVVLDAHCPHLGAHLGYQYDSEVIDDSGRRRVEQDNIRCPWHGWCWSPEGRNVEIPYSERNHTGKGLRAWEVREVNGWILIWHCALGGGPTWEPPTLPECLEGSDYYPYDWNRREWRNQPVQPQMIQENAVDFEHLRYVHRHSGEIHVDRIEIDGPRFSSWVSTTFTIKGGKKPGAYPGEIQPNIWGVGMGAIRLSGIHDITHVLNVTPVDEEFSDCFGAVAVRKVPGMSEPGNFARALAEQEHREFERDMVMWGNARFTQPAPFPREEKGFREMRKWAMQFYPEPATSEIRLDSRSSDEAMDSVGAETSASI